MRSGTKTVGFLSATGAVLLWEIYASWDDDSSTKPWTDLIVDYIPGEVTTVLLGGLIAWLPVHFGIRYWRKSRKQRDDGGV